MPFYKYLFYISAIYYVCIMRFVVYDMLVNVNVIYYVHVCEQARWARSAGNSAIENLCIIIIINKTNLQTWARFRTRRRRERCNTGIRLRCHLPRPLESESGTDQLTFRLGRGFALDAEKKKLQHRDPSAPASGYPASRGWKRNWPTN